MKVVNIAIVALITIIVVFMVFGCMNQPITENFENMQEPFDHPPENFENYASDGTLTQKEKELFQDLKENKLSTEEITDLVKGGVLTEKLVEKFLAELNAQIDDGSVPESFDIKEPFTASADVPEVEGFMNGGSSFASAL